MNDRKTKALVEELENEFPNIYDYLQLKLDLMLHVLVSF